MSVRGRDFGHCGGGVCLCPLRLARGHRLTQLRRWYQDRGGRGGSQPGRQDWWNGWYRGCGCW